MNGNKRKRVEQELQKLNRKKNGIREIVRELIGARKSWLEEGDEKNTTLGYRAESIV